MRKLTSLLLLLLEVSAGCSGVASPPDNPEGPPEPPARTTFPYDKLGEGTFWLTEGSRNYLVDSRSRTFTINTGTFGYGPAMSPDSRRVAFEIPSAPFINNKTSIIIADWGQSPAITLVSDDDDKNYPTWSRDGSTVMFMSRDFLVTVARLRKIDITTRVETTVNLQIDTRCLGTDLDRVSEAPDGTLAFLAGNPDGAGCFYPTLFSTRADGTGKKLIAQPEPKEQFYSPAWSPDGKRIVVGINVNVDPFANSYLTKIRLMNADGSSQKDLVSIERHTKYSHETPGDPLCWSADGTRILFGAIETDEIVHTYSIRPDGTDLTQITAGFMVECGR
jgi:Tol biopolymer transport system component